MRTPHLLYCHFRLDGAKAQPKSDVEGGRLPEQTDAMDWGRGHKGELPFLPAVGA